MRKRIHAPLPLTLHSFAIHLALRTAHQAVFLVVDAAYISNHHISHRY